MRKFNVLVLSLSVFFSPFVSGFEPGNFPPQPLPPLPDPPNSPPVHMPIPHEYPMPPTLPPEIPSDLPDPGPRPPTSDDILRNLPTTRANPSEENNQPQSPSVDASPSTSQVTPSRPVFPQAPAPQVLLHRYLPQPHRPPSNIEKQDVQCGSFLQIESLAMGETIPVVAAPFELVYSSARVVGRKGDYQIRIPVRNRSKWNSTAPICIQISVAGRFFTASVDPHQDFYELCWDGLDDKGQWVIGKVPAKITYTQGRSILSYALIGNFKPNYLGLGNWGVSLIHYYSAVEEQIYFGDGRVRHVRAPRFSNGNYLAPSEDGAEVYVFNSQGIHLETLFGLTGARLYQFQYDSEGYLQMIVDAYNNKTTFSRTNSGVMIRAPYGQITSLALDSQGNLASISNPNNKSYQMFYDSGGLLTRFQNPLGHVTRIDYNPLGYFVKYTGAGGNTFLLSRTLNNDQNHVTLSTAEGRQATYSFWTSATGAFAIRKKELDGTASLSKYRQGGSESLSNPFVEVLTRFGADARFGSRVNQPVDSRVTILDKPASSTQIQQRLDVGGIDKPNIFNFNSLDTLITKNGKTTDILYIQSLKKQVTTTPMGRKFTVVIDRQGKALLTQGAYLPTHYTYDERGQLAKIQTGGRRAFFKYDKGYLQSITDPLGRESRFENDAAGRVTATTLPSERRIEFQYDSHGNLISITPPQRQPHVFGIGLFELIESYIAPSINRSTSVFYSYNKDKQLNRIQFPGGETIELFYHESDNRLDSVAIAQGVYKHNYAEDGRLTSLTSPDGVQLNFEFFGPLPASETTMSPIGATTKVAFTYNRDLLLKTSTLSLSGDEIVYQYDRDGLVTRAGQQEIYRGRNSGQVAKTQVDQVIESYKYYQDFGELGSFNARFKKSPLYAESVIYDDLGRVRKRIEQYGLSKNEFAYTHDASGRLEQVEKNGSVQSQYQYDPNGNRQQAKIAGAFSQAHYDDQDRMISYGSKSYAYGPNGDLKSKTHGSRSTRYKYDVFGNLKSVILPNRMKIDYIVDGLNRRMAKKVNDQLQAQYVYESQLRIAAELDGHGNLVNRFVYGTKGNVPNYMIKAGVRYKIISDRLGSPRMVVHSQSGEIVQQIDYDEFGQVLSDSNPGFQPFGFAGGLYDPDTGLVRFGARDYDAETGRWTAKDPNLFAGGSTNLYEYAGNDPVNRIDPDGGFPIAVAAIAAAGMYFSATPTDTTITPAQEIQNGIIGAAIGGLGAVSAAEAGTSALILGLRTQPGQALFGRGGFLNSGWFRIGVGNLEKDLARGRGLNYPAEVFRIGIGNKKPVDILLGRRGITKPRGPTCDGGNQK